MSIRKSALFVSLVALPWVSMAATSTCSPKMGPAEQIACLQTQNAVLKEMIQNRDLYKKLDDGEKSASKRNLPLPLVMSIFGSGHKVQAVLSYVGQGGGALTVSVGDDLPDGWKVDQIGNGRVRIVKGRVSHILLLANGAPEQRGPEIVGLGASTLAPAAGRPTATVSVPPMSPFLPPAMNTTGDR